MDTTERLNCTDAHTSAHNDSFTSSLPAWHPQEFGLKGNLKTKERGARLPTSTHSHLQASHPPFSAPLSSELLPVLVSLGQFPPQEASSPCCRQRLSDALPTAPRQGPTLLPCQLPVGAREAGCTSSPTGSGPLCLESRTHHTLHTSFYLRHPRGEWHMSQLLRDAAASWDGLVNVHSGSGQSRYCRALRTTTGCNSLALSRCPLAQMDG